MARRQRSSSVKSCTATDGTKKEPVDHRLVDLRTIRRLCGGPLKERETSQAGMPLLANLLLNRKSGCRYRGMGRALFIGFRIYGANQMIDGRLFPYVPSPCATSRQGGFGHR